MPHPAFRRLVVLAALAAAASSPARAQGRGVVPIPRLEGPVRLDGVSDEAAWEAVAPLPLTMYLPTFRGEPTERTEIRVAHDGAHLWLAGRFYDSDPAGIRVNSLYRDRWSGDDALDICIDPFNDNQNALWFTTTPAGVRIDVSIADDGGTTNGSWNTYWDAEARVTEEGWFVEVRIPFSSLGFEAHGDRVVMGLSVTRLVSRKNERVTFPAIDPRYGFRQPSVFQDVSLEGLEAGRPAYVTAHGLAGVSRTPVLAADRAGYAARDAADGELGLDAKVTLSGNLTLDLTTNPDFAQVEADDEQINLDRFPLFFPEKRQFFQERSGIFDFHMGDAGRLLHTRRIGLSDARTAVPIPAGARLVGRVGDWDVGLMDMQTAAHDGAPSLNYGVARLRRRVLNPYSYVGGMLTTRLGGGDGASVAYGLDGSFRVAGDEYVSVKWAQSLDGASERPGLWDTSAAQIQYERRRHRGLQYNLQYARAGRSFEPGIGFVGRRDFTRASGYFQYWWFREESSPIRYLLPGVALNTFTNNATGDLESVGLYHWWTIEGKSGAQGWIEPEFFYERVREPFLLSGKVEIPPGRYRFGDLWLNYAMPAGRLLRTGIDVKVGTYYGGRRLRLALTPTWNVSERLEIGASWEANFIRFAGRDTTLDTHLARLRVRTAWNAKASANAFVQYSTAAGEVGVNVRFRYNVREGNDFWIVFNSAVLTDRLPLDPSLPRLPLNGARALIVKYTHTLAF